MIQAQERAPIGGLGPARAAQPQWAAVPLAERVKLLKAATAALAKDTEGPRRRQPHAHISLLCVMRPMRVGKGEVRILNL